MPDLGAFQDAFAAALAGNGEGLAPWLAGPDAGLAVYRNTVAKGAIDALVANFPTVEVLVGPQWMRAAAAAFAATCPPADPVLALYGGAFPDWLAAFGPASDMPWLADAARADRAWTEAHLAADAASIGADALAAVGVEALAITAARLHPSVRFLTLTSGSASLWLAHRPPAVPPAAFALDDEPEALLIARPDDVVRSRLLTAGEHAFLTTCLSARPLAVAAAAALEAEADADLACILTAVFADGLITHLEPARET